MLKTEEMFAAWSHPCGLKRFWALCTRRSLEARGLSLCACCRAGRQLQLPPDKAVPHPMAT